MNVWDELPGDMQYALEEAAQWRLRLAQEPDLELSSEFQSWITSPLNAHAFESVEAGWLAVSELSASHELLDLRRRALKSAQRANAGRWLPRRAMAWTAVLLLTVAAVGGGALYIYVNGPTNYETEVGVRRLATLPDGSRILLDSASKVLVRYSDKGRKIELDHGRARFDVAHDATRPFTVTVGTETVVAIGTSFTAEKIGSKVVVTLIQGQVVIEESAPSISQEKHEMQISLNAGQEFVVSRGEAPVVQPTNLQTVSAWEAGQLVFKDVTLEDATARENRYTDKPIIVDPSAASIRISGVFNAGDVGSFVGAVTSYLPVLATTAADDRIVLRRRL